MVFTVFITHTVSFITYSVLFLPLFRVKCKILVPEKLSSHLSVTKGITVMPCHLTVCSYSSASLSPDIAETSEPVPAVSQLEGSPMDTSSPASATQEEPALSSAQPNHMSQELSGSGESGLTDRQTDADTG